MKTTKSSPFHARQVVEPRIAQQPPLPSVHTKLVYTPEEAAELLSFSRSRIYILMAQEVITSFKEGRCRLVPAMALDTYLQRRLAEQASLFSAAASA